MTPLPKREGREATKWYRNITGEEAHPATHEQATVPNEQRGKRFNLQIRPHSSHRNAMGTKRMEGRSEIANTLHQNRRQNQNQWRHDEPRR